MMFASILARYGTIDIVVNNAGIGEISGQGEIERMNRIAEARSRRWLVDAVGSKRLPATGEDFLCGRR
jgi:NAD(P)-dependent dehydrogenase (short-subunit alcohol dehydrogenase family)